MKKWFYKVPRIFQLILLFVPVVNWVIEACIRCEVASSAKKGKLFYWIFAIIAIFGGGLVFGWIDVICVLFTKHLFLAK